MQLVRYIVTILMFLGIPLLTMVGFPITGDNAYFFPAVYILFFVYLYQFVFNFKLFKGPIKYVSFIFIALFLVRVFFSLILGVGRENNINNIALPALYASLFMLKTTDAERFKIRDVLIIMYVINCSIAIIERSIHTCFFPVETIWDYMEVSASEFKDASIFRSSALAGHPLTNALYMSIIMAFILLDQEMSSKRKYLLYILGAISLLCFNARAAIMITAFSFLCYVLKVLLQKKTRFSTRFYIVMIAIFSIFLFDYLFDIGLGGRLLQTEKDDSSIAARYDVWLILINADVDTLLYGMNYMLRDVYAMNYVGTFHVENWLIAFILMFGVVWTSVFILLFIPLFRYYMHPYNLFAKIMCFGVFIIIASTNNSLASSVQAIQLFFACCYAFLPKGRSFPYVYNAVKI